MVMPLGVSVFLVLFLTFVIGRIVMDNYVAKDAMHYLDKEIAILKEYLDAFSMKNDRVMSIPLSQLSQLIEEVTRLGKNTNIDFIAIQSREPHGRKKEIYQKMPLEISVRSDFKKLADFLGALRELQTTTIIITQFKLARDDQSPALIRGDISAEVLIKNAQ